MMGYTTDERNQRVKHISEMFEGGTVEEQVHNLFTTKGFWDAPYYLNFSEVCRTFYGDDMPKETDPDDWREADEQDDTDNE
jgi:hypothetical protein